MTTLVVCLLVGICQSKHNLFLESGLGDKERGHKLWFRLILSYQATAADVLEKDF